LSIKIM